MRLVLGIVIGLLLLSTFPLRADEAKPAAEKKTEEPLLQIVPAAHGWTLHAVGVDAEELLTAFAAKAQLQILIDDTVKRKITIHLLDKPALDVLNIIVDAYGLSMAAVDGVYIISEGIPNSPSTYLLSDIDSTTLKYVSPSQAVQLLPVFLQGQVKINADRNAVVLSGPKPVLDKFRQDIEQFDTPTAQIMLDVNVVEFTADSDATFTSLLGRNNAKLGLTTDSLTGQLTLNALTDLPTNFMATLQSLEEKDLAHVRANPRVATLSGMSANLFIGQQQYLGTPVDTGSGVSNNITAGVSLTMSPLTGGGGEIILDLSEEVSTLSAPDPVTGLPTKTTRTANTSIRVHDGQTIVTGGLRQEETRSVKTAIPILGSLPLIGNFFRSNDTEKTNEDLVIFITARLLSNSGHLPAAEERDIKTRMSIPALGESHVK